MSAVFGLPVYGGFPTKHVTPDAARQFKNELRDVGWSAVVLPMFLSTPNSSLEVAYVKAVRDDIKVVAEWARPIGTEPWARRNVRVWLRHKHHAQSDFYQLHHADRNRSRCIDMTWEQLATFVLLADANALAELTSLPLRAVA